MHVYYLRILLLDTLEKSIAYSTLWSHAPDRNKFVSVVSDFGE